MSLEGGDREARNIDIETAYVHQAYQQISGLANFDSEGPDRAWPAVTSFLGALEPGSIVCDVGTYTEDINTNNTRRRHKVDRIH